jgi:putative sigma-54 modulation protein
MRVYDATKELAEKKLAKLGKFFPDTAEIDITFSKEKNLEIVEITIHSDGMMFRAEESADTFANAIDSAIDALERQIRKNKTRLQKRIREEGFQIAEEDFPDINEEHMFEVRTKSFYFKPMSVEEAILQMELLGHTFFVFKDDHSLETCVVYKRNNGGYGLIVDNV